MHSLAILLTVAISSSPNLGSNLKDVSPNPHSIKSLMKVPGQYIIAQKYGGADPHGDDPHGDDPHDENHDRGLPANQDKTGKAPKDVYGGSVPNDQQPY